MGQIPSVVGTMGFACDTGGKGAALVFEKERACFFPVLPVYSLTYDRFSISPEGFTVGTWTTTGRSQRHLGPLFLYKDIYGYI